MSILIYVETYCLGFLRLLSFDRNFTIGYERSQDLLRTPLQFPGLFSDECLFPNCMSISFFLIMTNIF